MDFIAHQKRFINIEQFRLGDVFKIKLRQDTAEI